MTKAKLNGRLAKRLEDLQRKDLEIRNMGPAAIRWSWPAGDKEPRIDVIQDLFVPASPSNHYYTIRYPEESPPGARYKIDEAPPMTIRQEEQLKEMKLSLEGKWREEKEILDTLLKLWPDNRIGVQYAPGTCSARVACAHESSRSITYKYNVYAHCGFSIEVSIFLTYGTRTGLAARAVVSLDTGNPYRLISIELPIRDGIVDPTPLKEYLNNNPFEVMGKALKAYSDTSLSSDYTYSRWTNP